MAVFDINRLDDSRCEGQSDARTKLEGRINLVGLASASIVHRDSAGMREGKDKPSHRRGF